MESDATARSRRAHWAVEKARRKEIVNAARMYERAATISQGLSCGRLIALRKGEDTSELRSRWQAAVSDANAAWRTLVRLIAADEHAMVDGILYCRSRRGDVIRFDVGAIEDWGVKL